MILSSASHSNKPEATARTEVKSSDLKLPLSIEIAILYCNFNQIKFDALAPLGRLCLHIELMSNLLISLPNLCCIFKRSSKLYFSPCCGLDLKIFNLLNKLPNLRKVYVSIVYLEGIMASKLHL